MSNIIVIEQFQKVSIAGMEIYTNGAGELFVEPKGSTEAVRMCSTKDGNLLISADKFEISKYGGSVGLVIKN